MSHFNLPAPTGELFADFEIGRAHARLLLEDLSARDDLFDQLQTATEELSEQQDMVAAGFVLEVGRFMVDRVAARMGCDLASEGLHLEGHA